LTDDRAGRGASQELLIAIGRLGKPHGVRGEIKFTPYFGHDLMYTLVGQELLLMSAKGTDRDALVLESVRDADKKMIIAFEGVETPEEANGLASRAVQVPRSMMPPLPDGKFYYEEIIGLPVFDPQGGKLGRLVDFFEAGSADVWVIKTDTGEEIMTPCIPETLLKVDLGEKRIVMKLMEME